MMIYLDENQVRDIIKTAERERQAVSIRCIRKTEGDNIYNTVKGELHTIICGPKPEYRPKKKRIVRSNREEEDANNKVLTVWALNRRTGSKMGAWRRVNLAAVQEVRYKEQEFKVVHS